MAGRRGGKRRRVRRSAEEAQRLILDAAEKRLREGGPEAIRLQDIARDVGISHPAILHHFASRDGLTQALERRAMARLEAELVESLSSRPAVGGTAVDVIERAFATLGDAGHARMLAWRVLQLPHPENPDVERRLLRALADVVHARRVALAEAEGRALPSAQDSEFIVRLAAAAMLGDGIFAPFLDASFGRENDPARQRRFREWFARLLVAHMGAERRRAATRRGYHERVSVPAATPVPLSPAPAPRFDGWRMVALGALAQGLAMPLLGAYGIVATPVIEEFSASTTQLGIGMSLALLAAALASPALGVALDRGPLRAIMFSGAALMFASVFALSRGAALWQLAVSFAGATVGMVMYGMLPVQVILVNWFALRRGIALSVAYVGTSLGALIVPPATAWLTEWLGWRDALVAVAAGAAVLAVPVIAGLVKHPEELGQAPDGLPAQPIPHGDGTRAVRGSGRWLRDPNFWLIGAGVGLALSVSIAALFLVRHLETLGIPRTRAALVPSAIALFGIAGKLTAGWLIDRIDARAVVVGVLVLHALGWTIVASQSSYAAMFFAAAPLGLGIGGFLPLPAVLQGRCFGRAAIGRIGGIHALIGLPFLLAVAPLIGWSEGLTGGFAAGFFGLAGTLALAAAVLACVRIPKVEPVGS